MNLLVVVPEEGKIEAEIALLKGKVAETFDRCKSRVQEISHRVRLKTPDTLVDLGARSLCVSMDAIWVPPTFMHGPIRWGFPRRWAGWRIAYGADICGNYDRVASHCKFFGDGRERGGQDRKPHADPATGLTQQAFDGVLQSRGRIGSAELFNMGEMWLTFIAHYYDWTGDAAYVRSMWPAIHDALEYEKRAYDMDGDSLYENYANTYITDSHWHSGGNCTQASTYAYVGNLLAAEAARLVGGSPEPYVAEAKRIREAMNRVLWMKQKGIYAEWRDVIGQKLLHEEPEIGSLYLSINNGVADPFQAYQLLRFSEWGLPNYVYEERGPQPFDGYYGKGSTYEFPQPMQAREVKSTNWRPMLVTCCECSPGEQMDWRGRTISLG